MEKFYIVKWLFTFITMILYNKLQNKNEFPVKDLKDVLSIEVDYLFIVLKIDTGRTHYFR